MFKQQGRVSLDADYNENIMIQTQRNQQEIRDIIGNGVPIGQNRENIDAFKIQPLNRNGFDFIIHSGRIYVNGLLCELEKISGEHQTYLKQIDYPYPPAVNPNGRDLIYLDVWQRHITAIEDPTIREVALGGPDTCTRLKTVVQVKILENFKGNCKKALDWLNELFPNINHRGKLAVHIAPPKHSLKFSKKGGYIGMENNLYRVEIHKSGNISEAVFKWSRNNGAILSALKDVQIEGPKIQVVIERLSKDGIIRFTINDIVELSDEYNDLHNQHGILAKINSKIDPITGITTLEILDDNDLSEISDRISNLNNPKLRKMGRLGIN